MYESNRKWSVSFNSPVVLGFAAVCVLVQLISMLTGGASNRLLFSVYRCSPLDPLGWFRMIGHVLGHGSWSHLTGNLTYLLLLGPLLEEKYGSQRLLIVMVVTALVTGLVNVLFFPGTALHGASGIVFAMILLSSITSVKERTIPITFVLAVVFYLGQEAAQGLFASDNISQMAHIIGGAVGSVLGFTMNRRKA